MFFTLFESDLVIIASPVFFILIDKSFKSISILPSCKPVFMACSTNNPFLIFLGSNKERSSREKIDEIKTFSELVSLLIKSRCSGTCTLSLKKISPISKESLSLACFDSGNCSIRFLVYERASSGMESTIKKSFLKTFEIISFLLF